MNYCQFFRAEIPESLAGMRLDQALSEVFPDFSRSRLQSWIKSGAARVNGAVLPAKYRIVGGEAVVLKAEIEADVNLEGQDIPLSIMHEDEVLLILDKPAGLVVHPAAGHRDGTLLNALLHHCPSLNTLPRCGIVHRLDKDTSGVLMVAKTLEAHKLLVEQLQAREVFREYLALVHGEVTGGATIDAPLGRHPTDRKRIAVRVGGKRAVTHYRIEQRFSGLTLLRVKLETGRTHQIRVHMAHAKFPLVGDPVYGGRPRLPLGADPHGLDRLRGFRRQALHAAQLGIVHPRSGDYRQWSSPVPDDFQQLLDSLGHA